MFWPHEDLLSDSLVGSETEALQTDIQRFIAILGFCLMAIFALVQSIEVTVPKGQTFIEDLSRKVEIQQKDLEILKSENRSLTKEVTLLLQYTAEAKSLKKELEEAEKKLSRQSDKIDELLRDKIERQSDLVKYRELIDRKEEKIARIDYEKERMELLLNKAIYKLKDAAKLKQEKARLEKMLKEKQKQQEKAPEKKKGLYVAFASDQVFMDLLDSKKVQLFINVEGMNKGFRVIERDGRIDFETQFPSSNLDLWKIGEELVPSRIRNSFNAWTTLSTRKKMFIVGLKPQISRQIRGKSVTSGRFIIESGGSVSFSQFGE